MAIILSAPPVSGESEWFFEHYDRIQEVLPRFGNIDPFVTPHCRPVRRYYVEKIFNLFGELAEWAPHDLAVSREKFTRITARNTVRSDSFGESRVYSHAQMCFFIKVYLRGNNLPELPHELKGIGTNFFENIDKYAQLLEDLLRIVRGRRLELMEGIRLRKKFIDQIIGQFVHYYFWYMINTRNYPMKHLRIIR
ncbi:MAG: hypothetical protein QMD77_03720 [Patescibacteria group bacterium]|nr:hypothetical protein [Patescibacteria group bacterium]